MSSLFQLKTEAKKIYDYLSSLDMDDEVILDTIEAETDLIPKLKSYGHVIRVFQAEALAIKAERDRLEKRLKTTENHIKRLEKNIFDAMVTTGVEEVKDDLFILKIRNNPESVNIVDESLIPDLFFKIKREPMKTEIKTALKNGETVQGCELVRTQSLSMK